MPSSPADTSSRDRHLRGGLLLTDCVFDSAARERRGTQACIGVLPGEGIGPELVNCALRVLDGLESASGRSFERVFGGAIGTTAELIHGTPLPDGIADFCEALFARGAPILAGPGGGRFVYALRTRFDLFCKFAPLQISPTLVRANRLKSDHVAGLDILIVRENTGGVYQGRWSTSRLPSGTAYAEQTFGYGEDEIRRIIAVATRAAVRRRGDLTVIVKDGGIPALSELWRTCALDIAAEAGVRASFVNIDLAAYQLVQEPRRFDVVVCPNLFGDVLADLGAVLLGSRGLSYSGNFSTCGRAVYQTNHGSGHDLAGRGMANPVAQVFSLAMLLRESFGLDREAAWIERAVETVWAEGWRTFDLPEAGCKTIGTRELTERIADSLVRLMTAATR
jgi:3-isopropylmalate dehydrogenase